MKMKMKKKTRKRKNQINNRVIKCQGNKIKRINKIKPNKIIY